MGVQPAVELEAGGWAASSRTCTYNTVLFAAWYSLTTRPCFQPHAVIPAPHVSTSQLIPEYEHTYALALEEKDAVVQSSQEQVASMEARDMAELRALHKPPPEIEQLLTAVIMIIKSPGADVSWTKGAKRLMANLDRWVLTWPSMYTVGGPCVQWCDVIVFPRAPGSRTSCWSTARGRRTPR